MNELHKYATFSVDLLGTPNKINSTFSIGRARIFYKGINRNRSIIEGEVAEQLASTIPGTPVIGTFNYETRDFEGHEENPSAFGFIPLDPHAAWVKQDGSEKEYLEVDVVIWDGRFEEAQDILKKGDGVEPCFEDAQFITAFSNMVSAYAMYVEEAQKNNEGGKNIMDNIAEIVEPEVTTNPVEEEAAEVVETEAEVTETVEPEVETEEVAVETEEENAEETEIVETVEETSEGTEFASEDKEDDDDDEEDDDEEVCPECGKNPCVCENACNKEKDYSALEAELADYKAKYESLENKYNDALSSLNKYTKKEKLEIINKFSTKLESDELIEKLTNEVDERSLDEIKNELGQALVEQLSAEEETETTDTDSNFSLNINIADNNVGNSAWDLVKRHKANK